jgi:hypothetical protein
VRAGETINDIISKRNIARAEVDALNPEVNLDRLSRKWTKLTDMALRAPISMQDDIMALPWAQGVVSAIGTQWRSQAGQFRRYPARELQQTFMAAAVRHWASPGCQLLTKSMVAEPCKMCHDGKDVT